MKIVGVQYVVAVVVVVVVVFVVVVVVVVLVIGGGGSRAVVDVVGDTVCFRCGLPEFFRLLSYYAA